MSKQILLIDDDFDEQDIFEEAVTNAKLAVKCFFASSAKQGLELLDILIPDFIFLDINMPVVNGFECLQAIRQKHDLNEIPVIMYSTGVDENAITKAISLGASACIKKHDTINALSDMLKKILRYNDNNI